MSDYIHIQLKISAPGFENEEWPIGFNMLPRMGECVKAKSGRMLTVVSVVHGQDVIFPREGGVGLINFNEWGVYRHIVEIELGPGK